MPLTNEQELVVLTAAMLPAVVITAFEIRAKLHGNKCATSARFLNTSALFLQFGYLFFVITSFGYLFFVITSKMDSDEFMPKCAQAEDPVYLENHLRSGGNPNTRDGYSGSTLLIIAAGNGNNRVVRRLLAYGADPSLVDPQGRTALDAAEEGWRLTQEKQAEYEDTIMALRDRTQTGR